MEIESVRQQFEELLLLFDDSQKSTDDVVFATLSYLKNAHLVGQLLLLEGRFAEMQRCLDLCRCAFVDSTFEGLTNTCSRAEARKLARISSNPAPEGGAERGSVAGESARSSSPGMSSYAGVGLRSPRISRHYSCIDALSGTPQPQFFRPRTPFKDDQRVSALYLSAGNECCEAGNPRQLSEDDRRLLEALQDRTAQMQRQCDYARDTRRGRDTQYYIKKLRLDMTRRRDAAAVSHAVSPPPLSEGRRTPARSLSPWSDSVGSLSQSNVLLPSAAPPPRRRPPPPSERGVSIGRHTKLNQYKILRDLPALVTSAEPFFSRELDSGREVRKEDDGGAGNVRKCYRALQEKSPIIDADWDDDGAAPQTPLYLKAVSRDILDSPGGPMGGGDGAENKELKFRSAFSTRAAFGANTKKGEVSEFRDRAPLFVPQPQIPLPEIKKHILGYKRRSLTESFNSMRAHRSPSTGLTPYRMQSPVTVGVPFGSFNSPASMLNPSEEWRSTSCVLMNDEEEEERLSEVSDLLDEDDRTSASLMDAGSKSDLSALVHSPTRGSSIADLMITKEVTDPLSPLRESTVHHVMHPMSQAGDIVARSMRKVQRAQRAMRRAESHLSVLHTRSNSLIDLHYVLNKPKPLALQEGVQILPLLFSNDQYFNKAGNESDELKAGDRTMHPGELTHNGPMEPPETSGKRRPSNLRTKGRTSLLQEMPALSTDSSDATHPPPPSRPTFTGGLVVPMYAVSNLSSPTCHRQATALWLNSTTMDNHLTARQRQQQRFDSSVSGGGMAESMLCEASMTAAPSMQSESQCRDLRTSGSLHGTSRSEDLPVPPRCDQSCSGEISFSVLRRRGDAVDRQKLDRRCSTSGVVVGESPLRGVEPPTKGEVEVPVEVQRLENHLQTLASHLSTSARLTVGDQLQLLETSPYQYDAGAKEVVREHLEERAFSHRLSRIAVPPPDEPLIRYSSSKSAAEDVPSCSTVGPQGSDDDPDAVPSCVSLVLPPVAPPHRKLTRQAPLCRSSGSGRTRWAVPHHHCRAPPSRLSSPDTEMPLPDWTAGDFSVPSMPLSTSSEAPPADFDAVPSSSRSTVAGGAGCPSAVVTSPSGVTCAPFRLMRAAFRIQRVWRRYVSRHQLERRQTLTACLLEHSVTRDAAALIIQTTVRCFLSTRSCRKLLQEQKRGSEGYTATSSPCTTGRPLPEDFFATVLSPLQTHRTEDSTVGRNSTLAPEEPRVMSPLFAAAPSLYDVPSSLRGSVRSIALRRLHKQFAARVIARSYRRYRMGSQESREATAMLLFLTGKCSVDYLALVTGLDEPSSSPVCSVRSTTDTMSESSAKTKKLPS